jgi:class 3 adenylate cyclase
MDTPSRDRFPPRFFDLPQSAGSTLPIPIITEWLDGEQTADVARRLLAPHLLDGTIVCSDSSGLTRLGRERPLIEILAMIGAPKEIIHAHGRAIGGRAIGVWAADNTMMFYDRSIPADTIVRMLRSAAARMAAECELGVGMAAHAGKFFELAGSIYGVDAERIETVAEEHTSGGELIVSTSVMRQLSADHGFDVALRADLGDFLRITAGPLLADIEATDIDYPAPYSSDFTLGLATYTRTRRDSRMPKKAYDDLAVVLIEREPERSDVAEVAMLENLALIAAMKHIGLALLERHAGREVKNVGLIGIYTFADSATAVAFARDFKQTLADQGLRCRIGIDAGPVLVFELGPGSHDIAGSPVNVASKLAQDVGEYGMIQISDEVARRANTKRERPTRTFHVSGVELKAYDV